MTHLNTQKEVHEGWQQRIKDYVNSEKANGIEKYTVRVSDTSVNIHGWLRLIVIGGYLWSTRPRASEIGALVSDCAYGKLIASGRWEK